MAASPGTPFCRFAAVTLTNGAIGEVIGHRADDARALLRVASGVTGNPEEIAVLLSVPRAMLGDPVDLPDRPPAWWYLQICRILASAQAGRWTALPDEPAALRSLSTNGARALGALADAIDETRAAASGGPAPSHVGLRSLGLVGWSQLLASGSGWSAPR